jgi:hypothetical protein
MKNIKFTLLVFLLMPVVIHAQYLGGNGRGDVSLALNGTFLTNYFKTAGNWSTTGNWSDGILPTSSENANVAAAALVDGDYSYPALTIASTGSVTISPGKSLAISGAIANSAGTNGLVIQSNASLLHIAANVSGTVKRTIEKNSKWHFLSCPVNQAAMPEICDGKFAPITTNFNSTTGPTYDFFYWQEPFATGNLNWINLKNPDWSVNTTDFGNPPRFVTGIGYLVEYGSSFSGSSEKTFTGTLGVGITDIPVTRTTDGTLFNLIGNPYPSYIDWKAPVGWTRSTLEGGGGGGGGINIWIWNDAVGNYGVYNSASADNAGTNGVSRYIAPEQGFFVQAASSGNVNMTDDVRCHSTQAWLKASGNSLRIIATSSLNEYSDEVMMEFGHQVTSGAEKWFSLYPDAPSLYLPIGENIYSLRFLGEILENPVIPLSFQPGQNGNFTITANGTEFFTNVILQDLKTGTSQEMKTNPVYDFTSATSDGVNRFLIRFSPVGIEFPGKENNGIYVYDNTLYISNPGESFLEIYDMIGKKMVSEKTHNEPLYQLKLQLVTGFYLVRGTNGHKEFAEKVFVK